MFVLIAKSRACSQAYPASSNCSWQRSLGISNSLTGLVLPVWSQASDRTMRYKCTENMGYATLTRSMALTYVSLVVFASIFLALNALRRYLVRNPLDNVRGPTPLSILTGTHIAIDPSMLTAFGYIGDMEVLFHRHKGWDFVRKLEGYGSIARVQGIFGVRILNYIALPFQRLTVPKLQSQGPFLCSTLLHCSTWQPRTACNLSCRTGLWRTSQSISSKW